MKKYLKIICCEFLCLLVPVILFAQKQTGFIKTYKPPNNGSIGSTIVINPDSTYVFSAKGGISGSIWLVKLTSKGDTIWSSSPGSTIVPFIMIRDSGGNYLVTGQFQDSLKIMHTMLLKTDSNGNKLWLKTYDGHEGLSLLQAKGGGYIIGANGWNDVSLGLYVIKTDSNGNTLWSKDYGTSNGAELGILIHQLPDGGYSFWAVQELNNNNLVAYLYFTKINAKGDTLWTKVDYNHQTTGFMSSCYTLDGGYILGGGAYRNQTLMKFDSSGNIQWEKSCCGRDTFDITRSIMQDTNGNLIACGYIRDTANKKKLNGFLFKTDSLGNPLWVRTYGWKTTDDVVFQGKQTLDGGFALVGYSFVDSPIPTSKALVIKTDSLGCVYYPGAYFTADTQQIKEGDTIHFTDTSKIINDIAAGYTDNIVSRQWYFGDGDISTVQSPLHQYKDSGSYTVKLIVTNVSGCSDSAVKKDFIIVKKPVGMEEFEVQSLGFKVYPNPANSMLTVQTNAACRMQHVELRIYDLLGRKVLYSPLTTQHSQIDISSLQNGMYFYSITDNEQIIERDKLLVVK